MNLTIIETALIVLTIVVCVTTILRRFNIPVIVGYILVGILVSPKLYGWIHNAEGARALAEYGIVFLMFTLGLEFSLSRLLAMRKIVFGLGGLQLFLTIFLTTVIASGIDPLAGFMLGAILAMSSTAIVTKQLTEQTELNTDYGSIAVGILLFQDLAFIPLLILIPSLGGGEHHHLATSLVWASLKGLVAVVAILSIGHYLLRPFFYQITKRYSVELLTLSVLLIALSAAWLTHKLGLSLALGAFLAGIMLGETEFRHQIEATVSPFRDVLIALFFISVGMQLDLNIVLQSWDMVFWILVFIISSKIIIIFLLCILYGYKKIVALRTGLIMAQAGELGFVLLLSATSHHLFPNIFSQDILAAMLLSMLISPLLIQYNQAITDFIFHTTKQDKELKGTKSKAKHLHNHVIICGYGRVGQNITRLLESVKVPYIAFDLDVKRVEEAQLAGDNVNYGDVSQYPVLQTANIKQAKALVITFNNFQESLKILEAVRAEFKSLPIIIRSHDDAETKTFYQQGATEVIPEAIETSLVLASHIMVILKFPISTVHGIMDKIRQDRYAMLQRIFPSSTTTAEEEHYENILHAIVLTEDAYAINHKISEFNFSKLGVTLIRLRRGAKQYPNPKKNMILQQNDIIVLYGSQTAITDAERLLLAGGW